MSWFSDAYKSVTGGDAPAQSSGGGGGFFDGFLGGDSGTSGEGPFAKPIERTPEQKSQDKIDKLQQTRVKEARDFRTDLPNLRNDLTQNLMNQERKNLSNQLAQSKMGSNRRGLLGSGMAQAESAKLSNQSQSDVYKGVQTIGQSLNDQADQMALSAVQGGLDYWKSGQAIQDTAYSEALASMQANRANLAGAFNFAGSLAGNYYGSQNQNINYDPSGNPKNTGRV